MSDTLSSDDDADISQQFGQLSISSKENDDLQSSEDTSSVATVGYKFDKLVRAPPPGMFYEVTRATVQKENRSKFVEYTILMKHFPSDPAPCTLLKRYSDFADLVSQLKKQFPHQAKDFVLPPKQLTGNYTPKTIAERSRCFEQLLTHLSQKTELRFTDKFLMFIFGNHLTNAVQYFLDEKFIEAIPFFLKTLSLQRKLIGDVQTHTSLTMAALSLCYYYNGNETQAELFSKTAVHCLADGSVLLVPLLTFGIRLAWTLGKDKRNLEERLRNLKRNGINVEQQMTIHEAVKTQCQRILKP